MANELAVTERLGDIEARIDEALENVNLSRAVVGESLSEILIDSLWEGRGDSFHEYAEGRFGLKKARQNQLIAFANGRKLLESATTVAAKPPSSERQFRPLAVLQTRQEKVEAWDQANADAEGDGLDEPTPAHVEAAVRRMQPEAPVPSPGQVKKELRKKGLNLKGQLVRVFDALGCLEEYRGHLDKIGKGLGQ